MQKQAIVIGGGIIGCSVLYHLTKFGWSDVLLLERMELTVGSTWHAAGNVTLFNHSSDIIAFARESRRLYQEFEKETGEFIGYHENGTLRLARTQQALANYARQAEVLAYFGIPYDIVGSAVVKAKHPLLNVEKIVGALHVPSEGHMDANMTTHAFARAARERGAKIRLNARVTDITRNDDGGWSVKTEAEAYETPYLFICGGMWGAELGEMAGLPSVPIVAIERTNLVTEPMAELQGLPQELPIAIDYAAPYYARQEQTSLLVGVHEPHVPFCFEDGIPREFGAELFAVDYDRTADSIAEALDGIPAFGNAGIRTEICGPTSRTPDFNGLMGPVPGNPGLFMVSGFTSGVEQAAGTGYAAAQWAIEGETDIDVTGIESVRYGTYATKRYTREILKEGHTHGRTDTTLEKTAGRPSRTSALYYQQKAAGARFVTVNGWEVPRFFENGADSAASDQIGSEIETLVHGLGLIDRTSIAKMEVTGSGAFALVDRLLSCRTPEIGSQTNSCLLSGRGILIGVVKVMRLADQRFLFTAPARAEGRLQTWLERNAQHARHVRVENVTSRLGCLLLLGGRAADVLAACSDRRFDEQATELVHATIGFAPAWASQVSFGEISGWEIYHGLEYQPGLHQALTTLGECVPVSEVGLDAFTALRMTCGTAEWYADFRAGLDPRAAGVGHLIDGSKEEFVGRDAYLSRADVGSLTRIYAVELADVGEKPLVALQGGTVVGLIRTFSRALCGNLQLCFVSLNRPIEGDLECQIDGVTYPMRPFTPEA